MPHGLIFAGQKGIGKATMAYRLARFLLKHGTGNDAQDSLFGEAPSVPVSLEVAADDGVFRRVASGGHPDFMSVERAYDAAKNKYAAGVAVDEIRKVPGFLRMTASDGGWRVVIIDDADTMNRSAQNALLKILEEPPKNAVLILVAHRLGALIPTIRSRAQLFHFHPLAQDHVEALLVRQGTQARDVPGLTALAEGSIGKALQYAQEGGLDSLAQIMALLEGCPDWNWPEIHKMADGLAAPGQDQAYRNFAALLPWAFSQMAVAKARGIGLGAPLAGQGALEAFMHKATLEKLLKICENLHDHFTKVDGANLDKRQGILAAFTILAD